MKNSKSILLTIPLIVLSFLAVYLSYSSIHPFRTRVKAALTCHNDQAELTIVNEGDKVRMYYISIVKGDQILELNPLDRVIENGGSLTVRLNFRKGYRASILMDKGVIPGLECGEGSHSQP